MATVPPDKPGGFEDPGDPVPSLEAPASNPTASATNPTASGQQEQWPQLPQTQGPSTSTSTETGINSQKSTSRRSIGISQIAFNNALDKQTRQAIAPSLSYSGAAQATATRHPR